MILTLFNCSLVVRGRWLVFQFPVADCPESNPSSKTGYSDLRFEFFLSPSKNTCDNTSNQISAASFHILTN